MFFFFIYLIAFGSFVVHAQANSRVDVSEAESQKRPRSENLSQRVLELETQMKSLLVLVQSVSTKQEELIHRLDESRTPTGLLRRNRRRDAFAPKNRYTRSVDPDEVAFSAKLSHELSNIQAGRIVVFDDSITWTDHHYNNKTGIFTCPTSGLYLFAVFVESSVKAEAFLTLKRDGNEYMTAVSEPSETGEDDTGGNIVLLYMEKGQQVWVETKKLNDQSLWPYFTTFTGVMIYKN